MPSSQILLMMTALTGVTCLGAGLVLIVTGIALLIRKPAEDAADAGQVQRSKHYYDSAPTDPRG